MAWLKENWLILLGTGGMATALVTGLFTVVNTLINKHKPKDREIKPKRCNNNYCLARAQMEHENYPKALEHFLQSAEDYGEDLDNLGRAAAFHSAGIVCYALAKHDQAIEYFIKAQAVFYATPKTNQMSLAVVFNNFAIAYDTLGEHDKALFWYGKAFEILEKELGKKHPDGLMARVCCAIVDAYEKKGEHKKALAYYEAIAVYVKALGRKHPWLAIADMMVLGKGCLDTAAVYCAIANFYRGQKKFSEAIALYLQTYRIFLDSLGSEHPDTKSCLTNLRETYEASKRKIPFDKWLSKKFASTPP